jgi:mannan endo-1,4-beta-mannosidase
MYKNFFKALITRVNTVTGVAYRDDPTIFAWELINEPRVPSDPSGNVLQARRLRRCTLLCLA